MPKIDISTLPVRQGCPYPQPFDEPCAGRTRRRLGDAGGLRDFGVNLMHLPPGGWSAQRHWHSHEDEFVYVLEGELTLVEDDGGAPTPTDASCTRTARRIDASPYPPPQPSPARGRGFNVQAAMSPQTRCA